MGGSIDTKQILDEMDRATNAAREAYVRAGSAPADDVNHPAHYTAGGVECIDAIRAALTPEEFRGFCKGNILKYTWREKLKGGDESLKKARWYTNQLVGE